jgi:hypothetical protein
VRHASASYEYSFKGRWPEERYRVSNQVLLKLMIGITGNASGSVVPPSAAQSRLGTARQTVAKSRNGSNEVVRPGLPWRYHGCSQHVFNWITIGYTVTSDNAQSTGCEICA